MDPESHFGPPEDFRKEITITVTVGKHINLAMQQNAVPIIRELTVHNASDSVLEDFEICIDSDPAFIRPHSWHITSLAPKTDFHIKDLYVELSTTFFEALKEAVKGSLLFSILRDGTKEDLHFVEIELLGKDEWGGLAELPEIIAAFVQPNDPAVQAVLRDASKLLEKAGQKSTIEGYQAQSPKRVSTIVSAIWSAVCQLDLTYAVCPASFESQGQKIRKPSKVFETKLATCLDLSVFFASCLEQAGLHSVIFFTNDHVAIGCWLQDEDFSTSVIDSLQALRKRFQLKELLFFETTLTTNRPPTSFKFAVEETVKLLNNEQDFALAVDINRARHSRIRPVSDKDFKPYKAADADYVSVPLDILDDIPEESMVSSEPEKVSEGDLSNQRLERWKRKLLDLSLRNPLLNFRATKRIVTIDCPDLGYLEDQLADGKSLKFYATELLQDDGLRDGDIHKKQRQEELRKEKIVNALSKGEILTKLAKNDQLNSNLLELYRAAKGALQEGGSNILYLALGFLVWKQSESAERVHKAPLILIPVELTRKSVLSGFRLTLHEDEPRFNPTLLELLRQDFKLFLKELEGDLPTDTSGLDVAKIWRIVRTAVRDIPKWEVTEEAVLSTFSFSKYLMWCDLESRHEQLKNSPLVRHLIETPRDPYKAAGFVNANEIDENTHPKDIFCPLLADSSQLVACMTAAKGDSDFVLIGPPGTGKSQTIANMISQCLANGKTVLFVSEKTAALEVVYRRLRGINLDKFCLQLHSNKARKLEVIQQLGAAWDAEAQAAENWDKEADRLYNLRLGLSKYVSCLHKRHKNGMSIYRAIGLILKHEDTPNVNLQWPNYQAHDENDFEMLQEITKRIDINRSECGVLHENPLKEITLSGWSPSWQLQVSAMVAKLREKKNDCKSAFIEYTELLKLPVSLVSKPQLEALSELPAILSFAATNPCDFAFSASPAIIVEQMKMACKHIEDFQTLNDALSVPYNRDIFQKEDVPALMKQWEEGCQSFILKKWLSQKTVKKTMAAYVKNKEKQRLEHDFPILADIKNVLTEIEKLSELKQCLGPAWKEVDTSKNTLEALQTWYMDYSAALGKLGSDASDFVALKSILKALIVDVKDVLVEGGPFALKGLFYKEKWDELQNLLLESVQVMKEEGGGFASLYNSYWADIEKICSGLLENIHLLRYWCAWQSAKKDAIGASLKPLVDFVESGGDTNCDIKTLFMVNYCRWWVNAVIDEDEVLKNFVPAEHISKIKEFAELDVSLMKLTSQYVYAKIASSIPSRSSVPKNSGWSILSRELQKKKRHMPLRQLISKMPDVITNLTPCVMMSPMSIAQYLQADSELFDVVIFDEASQIAIWDAIGAIARGKHCIIVGDPKQLPPTSFFDRQDSEDADSDVEIEDLESILDEALGANVPNLLLNWHYRSRCESLISFSNHRYYGGHLVTFPSTKAGHMSVSFQHVQGIYEKGGSRTNPIEAKAIVDEISSRISEPGFNKTIGVVTFNESQKTLIENLFEDVRRKKTELEYHFSDERVEPLCVKNLENIQGDERDIIYFSVTFGPDIKGKVSHNFGPMNQDGGPRRLNVAITRARLEMRVFSSLLPEMIDLSRTDALGVKDLKHFIEFASRGYSALGEAVEAPLAKFDSPFEEAVAKRLTEKGWTLHSQVGVSGFKIDLGVVNPEFPGAYIAGIECDGATYHRSASVRDRDFLREKVLSGLGWNMLRVWSTDWWLNPQGATVRLHNALQLIIEEEKRKHDKEEKVIPIQPYLPVQEDEDETTLIRARLGNLQDTGAEMDQSDEVIEIPFGDEELESSGLATSVHRPSNRIRFDDYKVTDLFDVTDLDPDKFYDQSYNHKLIELIDRIVCCEGPIREDVLVQRISRAHNFKRSGNLINKRILALLPEKYQITDDGSFKFIWQEDTDISEWNVFRLQSPQYIRPAEQICFEELSVLAIEANNLFSSFDDALIWMTQRLNLKRLRGSSRQRVFKALEQYRN